VSSREEILGRVRSALTHAVPVEEVPREYADPPVENIPALFVERVEDYRAEVRVVDPGNVSEAVVEALSGIERVVVPDGLPKAWSAGLRETQVVSDTALTARELDQVGAVLTAAAVGIAVTGTIVLDHGPDQGRRALSLVPDVRVCIIGKSHLVAGVAAAVARLEARVGDGRPLTWISGPSATSDIELERVEGVHGPRRLRVLLVDDLP
jgi:L-lactate dehydrogenase complex protein LldG